MVVVQLLFPVMLTGELVIRPPSDFHSNCIESVNCVWMFNSVGVSSARCVGGVKSATSLGKFSGTFSTKTSTPVAVVPKKGVEYPPPVSYTHLPLPRYQLWEVPGAPDPFKKKSHQITVS